VGATAGVAVTMLAPQRLCPALRSMALVAPARRVASFSDRDRKDREAVERANLRGAGGMPISAMFFAGVGAVAVAYYNGWLSPGKEKKELQLVGRLRAAGVRVVVFDVEHVMSAAACHDGIARYELADFLAKTSQDLVPALRALAQSGFKLAVASSSEAPPQPSGSQRPADDRLYGADLARALLAERCPDLLPCFVALVGHDPPRHGGLVGKRHHMRSIAQMSGVPFRDMLLVGASARDLENEDGWLGVAVRDVREGFQFDDVLRAELRQHHGE